jgi:nitrous oxidase accessory protein NosD
MKIFISVLLFVALLSVTLPAHATNWCGQTMPTGNVYLDQQQDCYGQSIYLSAYTRLYGNGFRIICHGGGDGIYYRGAAWVALYNVHVSNCGRNGLYLEDTQWAWVEGGVFNYNSQNGIMCNKCTNTTLQYNQTAVNTTGVAMFGGANNNINGNSSWNNQYDGILFYNNTSQRGVANSVGGNGYKGVEFKGAQNSWVTRGSNGSVLFSNGASNNWARNYSDCRGDGTGSNNQCR